MQVNVRIPCEYCISAATPATSTSPGHKTYLPCDECNGTRWNEYWLPLPTLLQYMLEGVLERLPSE